MKRTLTFILLGFGLCFLTGCSGPTGNQIRVLVPTRSRIDLKQFDRIYIAKFLVTEKYEGIVKDTRTDYGEELQTLIRNEVQSYIHRQIVDIDPPVVDLLNPVKNNRTPSKTTTKGYEPFGHEPAPEIPDPDSWADPQKIFDWIKAYIIPVIESYEKEQKFNLPTPLFNIFTIHENPRRGLIFGLLNTTGIDRTHDVTQQTLPEGFDTRPQTLPSGTPKAEFKVGLRLIVIDLDQEEILYTEYREESFIVPGADEMQLGIFYGMMDRVMPHLLSSIVPIYLTTQRYIIDKPIKE